MAYNGTLIKIGNWKFDYNYIKKESYKIGSNKTKICDWIDYNGARHVVYSNDVTTVIEFNTDEEWELSNDDIAIINEALENAKYTGTGGNSDCYSITYYDPRYDAHFSKFFTLDDLDFEISRVSDDNVFYNSLTFRFEEVEPIEL